MKLSQILEDFNRTKEKIRNRTRFKVESLPKCDGLSMAVAYSNIMEYVVERLFDLASELTSNRTKEGIAAFLYGSPGRREMVCESDLDIMLVYRDKSEK